MFGIEDKYLQFRDSNKFILKPAIKELNQKSNLIVSVNTVKDGRNVVSLSLYISN
ncbi:MULTISPECIES: replication initiation protein [Photorhabdus]|uniref:replication initiation protein n=1 Tax=Photorhabdus TaxID=29487 RepID=UPI001EFEEA5A|nr:MULTISPECIES: replication initiation protein [Photorhabdus]MCT8342297.1 replication initiation protein [Photorhabdus kleinii]